VTWWATSSGPYCRTTQLCDLGPNDWVCSVGWTKQGTYLAVGTNQGEVQIWDANRCKKIRSMGGRGLHLSRFQHNLSRF